MESNSCVNIQKMMETWGRVTNHGCFIDLIKIHTCVNMRNLIYSIYKKEKGNFMKTYHEQIA